MIARLEVTIVLYFTGDDTATYLSTVSAMSIKIDAVHKIKYKMSKISISTMLSLSPLLVWKATDTGSIIVPTTRSVATRLDRK